MRIDHLLKAAVFSLLVWFWVLPMEAQQSTGKDTWLRVEMKDGSVFMGRRLAMTDEELILDSESIGKLNLPLAGIREIREMGHTSGGSQFAFEHIAAFQNVFGPSAYGLNKGQLQYGNFMLGVNQLGLGITDRFSLHMGLELFSLLFSFTADVSGGPGFYLRPHVSFPVKEGLLTIGGGVAVGGILNTGDDIWGIAPYGSFAIGNKDRNVNANLAFGIGSGGVSPPVFSLSGNYRISKRFGLTTENWIFPGDLGGTVVNAAGVRIYGERMSWNIALAGGGGSFGYDLFPLPLAGVVVSLR